MSANHHTPGSTRVADANPIRGLPVDTGVKVTTGPRVPPGPVIGIGGKNRAPDADTTQNNVASQSFGRGLPANVNR